MNKKGSSSVLFNSILSCSVCLYFDLSCALKDVPSETVEVLSLCPISHSFCFVQLYIYFVMF